MNAEAETLLKEADRLSPPAHLEKYEIEKYRAMTAQDIKEGGRFALWAATTALVWDAELFSGPGNLVSVPAEAVANAARFGSDAVSGLFAEMVAAPNLNVSVGPAGSGYAYKHGQEKSQYKEQSEASPAHLHPSESPPLAYQAGGFMGIVALATFTGAAINSAWRRRRTRRAILFKSSMSLDELESWYEPSG